jgi:hypothetical protein
MSLIGTTRKRSIGLVMSGVEGAAEVRPPAQALIHGRASYFCRCVAFFALLGGFFSSLSPISSKPT